MTMPATYETFHDGNTVPIDVCIVCLWSTLGLALTGVLFAAGLGTEIAQALMAAG